MGDTVEHLHPRRHRRVHQRRALQGIRASYLKRICDAFPDDWVKVYHNDAEVDACLDHLPDAGFNVLNWGKQKDIREVKARVGDRMCLMGNVNPLEIAVRGTPEEVRSYARRPGVDPAAKG